MNITVKSEALLCHVALCWYGIPCSGGEMFIGNLLPRLAKKYTSVGIFAYRSREAWEEKVSFESINLLERNIKNNLGNLEAVLYYALFFFKSLKLLKSGRLNPRIIISHSDAWPDLLFAFLFKLLNKDVKWIAINHLIVPNPFKGYTNIYTNKIKMPSLTDIYQWLNQRLFFLLQKKAELLVSINSNDLDYLRKKNKNVFIIKHGREYTAEPESGLSKKEYDVCFLGRFFIQKGIDEIPEILKKLAGISQVKLNVLFIGGENDYSGWLKGELNRIDIDYTFSGYVAGLEKFLLLKKSRVMILPSYFESFGIVYLDAISVGLPVVEYDLPCFIDHKWGALKVPFKDNESFARALYQIITDPELYRKLSVEGFQYSQDFSWDKSAESLNKYILNFYL